MTGALRISGALLLAWCAEDTVEQHLAESRHGEIFGKQKSQVEALVPTITNFLT